MGGNNSCRHVTYIIGRTREAPIGPTILKGGGGEEIVVGMLRIELSAYSSRLDRGGRRD